MLQEINFAGFRDAFQIRGRGDQFSYGALKELFNYLEDFGDYRLDVIGLCCEFHEEYIGDLLDDYDVSSIEELSDHVDIIAELGDTVLYHA
jgi:hypothetical protein